MAWPRSCSAGGVNVLTGGTDVHLVLVDCASPTSTASRRRIAWHDIGITVNRNAVPFDRGHPPVPSACAWAPPRSPPAASSVDDFREVGASIAEALTGDFSDAARSGLSSAPARWPTRYPLYPQLAAAAAV